MKILVTGGAGYIGSITCKVLEQRGHTPVVLDSLVTGPAAFARGRVFYRGDIADRELVATIVRDHPDIACTIHMAARVVVPESVAQPHVYYRDNVCKSLALFDQLVRLDRPRVVFSSSASVYAASDAEEVVEDSPLAPSSPYARTKAMVETVLQDMAKSSSMRAIILRYFNPIGSDPDLELGVHVREPSHVLGQLVMAAQGAKACFTLTGVDYPTRDGTGLRDYVHVWDLARAHVCAVERFDDVLAAEGSPCSVVNVGTGRGVTVRELVDTFSKVFGREVPTEVAPRRPGDVAGAYANVDKARLLLGWGAELTLEDAIASALRWSRQRERVLGYA
ncbi:UDP-glucose 4-epimerase GalE [Nocardioides caldifontis]|uniref:UDP-glucose 4-epimerase GalE n=1 Tax=Nocardioides caldifontis TaxID=2588938 RepID=UPI0011DFACDE|nr:UDP-glucose 4-epimerase GalE [Nocardioides caldifontis]